MYGPNMGCCCLTSHAQKKGSKKACVGNQRNLNMRGVWVPEYTLAVRKSFGGRGGLGLGIAIRVYATRLHALQRCHRLLGVPAASAAASAAATLVHGIGTLLALSAAPHCRPPVRAMQGATGALRVELLVPRWSPAPTAVRHHTPCAVGGMRMQCIPYK